jgi:ribonuclease HI
MSWARRSFKGQSVWVRVGADQRPVLDSEGRAEMKYRQEDAKSYRPSPGNLAPFAEDASPPVARTEPRPPRAPRAASGPPRARTRTTSASSTDDYAPGTIHVWTDGACSGNPGPMGIGIVVVADRQRAERGEYLGMGTNNIAELTAISRGLDLAAELAPDKARPIRIYSDSNYALGLLGKGWKAKANQDLVASLRDQLATFPLVKLVKVAGHAGVDNNERCDQLARQAVISRHNV